MSNKQIERLKKLKVFTLSQAKALGISQQQVSKYVQAGILKRMMQGVFIHSEANVDREIEFQISCAKLGSQAVIGGLSALFYYNLAEQVPNQTWVLVPPHKISNDDTFRLVRTKTPLDIGVTQKEGYKIVTIERAIIEGFKLATKIGERTAITAARSALANRMTTLKKLSEMAKNLELDAYLTKYFEAIIA